MVSVARADLQDLWARGVAEEDGQAELARLGDSVWIHIESLVADLRRGWRRGYKVEHHEGRHKTVRREAEALSQRTSFAVSNSATAWPTRPKPQMSM